LQAEATAFSSELILEKAENETARTGFARESGTAIRLKKELMQCRDQLDTLMLQVSQAQAETQV